MVHFPCPLCGQDGHAQLYPDTLGAQLPRFGYDFTPDHMKTYRVVFCRDCRHGYASPRPVHLWQQYKEVEDPAYLKRRPERLVSARRVLRRITGYRPSGRLLDIGCATGDFLSEAGRHFQTEGLELSDWAADIARARGLTVHRSNLADFKPGEPYDLLTLWGVIEHFEQPVEEIRRMHGLLRGGGLACLWTGDMASWPARLLGSRWWYIQGQHLQVFSHHSLRSAFAQAGFQEVWVGRYPHVTTLGSVAKSLSRYPAVGSAARWLVAHPAVSNFKVTLALPGEMFAIFKKP
jgi:SAM-dependent methyltransferase